MASAAAQAMKPTRSRSRRRRRSIGCGSPACAPSCARTARRSGCRATTTWATARSGTTRSAPARSTRRARCSSAARSRAARCSRARRGSEIIARGAARRRDPLPRPALRRQRPLAPRSPRGDARARAAKAGCKKLYVHALLDGRDVPPTSALEYVDRLERFLAGPARRSGVDARIVSGGGRMKITMDRYEADWDDGRARLAHARARRRARRSRRRPQAIETLSRRAPRHHRSGPAAVRRRARRRRSHDGDAVRDVQLPRRSRDRDLARVRRRRVRQVRSRAPPRRVLRRHDGVRRRPPHPEALPRLAAGDRAPDGRDPRRRARLAARDQRDPEVRPRDVLLERQPQRHVRRRHRDLHRDPVATACRSSSGRG